MREIYIDSEFKCFAKNDGNLLAVETDAFDGKCDAFVEGYRFVPAGKTWVREDGVSFAGEMIAPWKDHGELDAAQRLYEEQEREDMRNALNELGVYVNG